MNGLPPSVRENPPIPFVSKTRKTDNPEESSDKTEFIKLEFYMDPTNPASKYSRHFLIFKDGCAEDWVKWLMAYREIETLMTLKEPADKSKMVRTLLKGQALSHFEHHLKRRLDAEDAELPDNDLLDLVMRDVGLEYIPRSAIRVQKYYMRRGLFLGQNMSVQTFVERLNELNRYLLYFPEEHPKQLDQDEIIEILDQAKSPEWHAAMVAANIDIFSMTYEESVSYFKRLENLEKIRRTNGPSPALPVDNKKTVTSGSVGVAAGRKKPSKMWCHYCDKNNHNTADCRAIAKAKQLKNGHSEAKAVPGKKSLAFLFEEINLLKKQLNTKTPNSKKRKMESLLSTEINLTTSSDEDENYFPFFPSFTRIKSNKLAKTSHPTSELVVSLQLNNEEHLLRALADTGASSSIILEVYTSKQFIKTDKNNKTTWSTMGGQFTTDKTGLVNFLLPEFNLKKQISWEFHVDVRSKDSNTYDMIIGRDLLGELGIILNFNDHTVTWDTDTIPMKDRGTLNSQEALVEAYLASTEPQSLVDEFSRSTKIPRCRIQTCKLRRSHTNVLQSQCRRTTPFA